MLFLTYRVAVIGLGSKVRSISRVAIGIVAMALEEGLKTDF